jgi:periplasmic protein TonB
MESPKVDNDNAPQAPEDDTAQAYAPPVQEQQAEVKETNLPKDVPQEAEDPDRIVTTNDAKKPKEEDQKLAAVETQAVAPSEAHEDHSRQQLDENAPEGERAKAPNPNGIGKDRQRLTAEWGKKITAYFQLHKRYPENKLKTVTVKVALVLNRLGNVISAEIKESSGDPVFDDEAIAMVHRSDPVPTPPAGLTDDQFAFDLPVNFKKPK